MCDWKYEDGTTCKCKEIGITRGLNLCARHYDIIRRDNLYRAKHDHEIPHLDQTIKRRISKIILETKYE